MEKSGPDALFNLDTAYGFTYEATVKHQVHVPLQKGLLAALAVDTSPYPRPAAICEGRETTWKSRSGGPDQTLLEKSGPDAIYLESLQHQIHALVRHSSPLQLIPNFELYGNYC